MFLIVRPSRLIRHASFVWLDISLKFEPAHAFRQMPGISFDFRDIALKIVPRIRTPHFATRGDFANNVWRIRSVKGAEHLDFDTFYPDSKARQKRGRLALP
jgi:hypothetical protein